jgi:hypothetical protein
MANSVTGHMLQVQPLNQTFDANTEGVGQQAQGVKASTPSPIRESRKLCLPMCVIF